MRHILLASIAAFMCAPAIADTPSFNFVQAGYQEIDLDVGVAALMSKVTVLPSVALSSLAIAFSALLTTLISAFRPVSI